MVFEIPFGYKDMDVRINALHTESEFLDKVTMFYGF